MKFDGRPEAALSFVQASAPHPLSYQLECGKDVPGAGMAEHRIQRRLAAILAADMVDYSRLVGADEAGTLSRLKSLREELLAPNIGQYEGRIVKEMGDGLLAEFASVVGAVECAVTIQKEMAKREANSPEKTRIRYRAGINLGDIVIDGDDILGDGVNIAARLEGLAEPGGILISAAVFDQVRNKLDLACEDLGERNLKNIKEPVRVYRVFPIGRPEISELSREERSYRDRVRDRFAEDAAYYVPLSGRTRDIVLPDPAQVPRSVGRRKRRALFEYHEWISVGEDIKQVKVDSLSEVIRKYPSIILIGGPGCGKTTAIEAVAHELSELPDRLPLLVRLSEFTTLSSVEEFVSRIWGGAQEAGHWGAPELAANLERYLESGKLIILFDGLNEMPAQGYRERCVALRGFIDHWSARGNRFVVTCRALDYGEELSGLQRVEVQALSNDQIQHFLRNELPEKWPIFWDILRRDDSRHRLLEMARNPYLLTIMIDVFEQDGDLAQDRAKLMQRFTQILLDWARAKTPAENWLDAGLLSEALSVMAYEMQNRSGFGTRVRTEQIKTVMPHQLQLDPNWPSQPTPPDQVLSLAANANIVEMPVDRESVRFYHQLLQEYFAALRILRLDPTKLTELWRGAWLETEMPEWVRPDNNFDPLPPPPPTGWEETTILATGLSPASDDQLVHVLLHVNPVLAGRCLLQRHETIDSRIHKAVIAQLLAAITDPEVALRVRIAAGKVLGELGDPRLGEMMLVPAGNFLMGDGADKHSLFLPDFQICRYPLTNIEYQRFIDAGGYRDKSWWTEAGWLEIGQVQDKPRFWHDPRFNEPNQPAMGLSWYECVAYCRWLSAETGQPYRLPTEAEWEKGARGDDGRVYPWGDDRDPNRLNGRGPGSRQVCATTPVGIYPTGVSPFRLFDCVGNVWEWCSTRWKKPLPYDTGQNEWQAGYLEGQNLRVLRGGSWYNKWDATNCTHRFRFQPYGWNDRGGCRIVSPA
jgi:formylglycine-generating enzyme required for sulfatase activity/class 3 adenylate cyclase